MILWHFMSYSLGDFHTDSFLSCHLKEWLEVFIILSLVKCL